MQKRRNSSALALELRLFALSHRYSQVLINPHDLFTRILRGCFTGTGAMVKSEVSPKDMDY